MPRYAEGYEETINELRLQLEELTTERDELRAKLESGCYAMTLRDGHYNAFTDLSRHNATLILDNGAEI